ncbi:hypothetical protein CYMTET_27007, partial [Cymbomonas tetramitiformis]
MESSCKKFDEALLLSGTPTSESLEEIIEETDVDAPEDAFAWPDLGCVDEVDAHEDFEEGDSGDETESEEGSSGNDVDTEDEDPELTREAQSGAFDNFLDTSQSAGDEVTLLRSQLEAPVDAPVASSRQAQVDLSPQVEMCSSRVSVHMPVQPGRRPFLWVFFHRIDHQPGSGGYAKRRILVDTGAVRSAIDARVVPLLKTRQYGAVTIRSAAGTQVRKISKVRVSTGKKKGARR